MSVSIRHRLGHFFLSSLAVIAKIYSQIKFKLTDISDRNNCNRIILIEPYGMGDIISLQPLIEKLHSCGYEVTIIAKEKWKEIIPVEHVKEWIGCEVPWSNYHPKSKYRLNSIFSPKFRRFFRLLLHLPPGSIGFDTRGDIRSVLLLYLAGCRVVYSLSQYIGLDINMSPISAKLITYNREMRRWQQNNEFAKAVGCNSGHDASPSLKHLIKRHDKTCGSTTRKLVGILPVAPWEGRRWPSNYWKVFLDELKNWNVDILVLCGPGEKRTAIGLTNNSLPIRESHSVQEWVLELNKCHVVVTIDSGPMHICDSLNISLIVLVGPSKMPLWLPVSKKARVLHHQENYECAPCLQVGKYEKCGYECIRAVKPSEALNALKKMLSVSDCTL